MSEVETISAAGVEALREAAEVAHEAYSAAFEQHKAAESALGAAAGVRIALVQSIDANRKAAHALCHSAIENAIRGQDAFKTAAACLMATQNEGVLLGIALKKYCAYDFANAQRASLAAKLNMLQKQHVSESARHEHHVAEIHLSLGAAARANQGGIQVEMGGAVDARKRLCYSLARGADGLREEIERHDTETRALRAAFEKENL